jgi:hypothetical protein
MLPFAILFRPLTFYRPRFTSLPLHRRNRNLPAVGLHSIHCDSARRGGGISDASADGDESTHELDMGCARQGCSTLIRNSTDVSGGKWIFWMLGVNVPRKSHPAGGTPDARPPNASVTQCQAD